MPWFLRFCCALLCLAWPCAVAQAQWQDLLEIQRTAERFAHEQARTLPGRPEIAAGQLDPRTRLTRCESMQAFLPPGARLWGSSNVGVRCVRPQPWSVFVPVTVRVIAEVVVTSRGVARGQVLAQADVRLVSSDITRLPAGVLNDVGQALGKSVVAALPGGIALRADMLRAPPAVSQGQSVRIIFQGEGVRVDSEGRSLTTAAVGEPARVRTASGKVIEGIVHSPGVVEVR
jgi:flagella basal body P-ring formation protein FlgA